MKLYKYKIDYSGEIIIEEIEVTEKKVIYEEKNRGRIRKDETEQVHGRVFNSCIWCYMYSLSNKKVDFFKSELIKKLKRSKADYEKYVRECENQIRAIGNAIIKEIHSD